ncbi:MAG TPA: hypothetical protein VMS93_05835 [Candidatus Saccharimonadales bacterium]|nr:hypothetical protein [Candidatus Saccharimonadales bacterium]
MPDSRFVSVGRRLLMALSFGLLAAGTPAGGNAPADFTLDFVSDLKGNLEPCG